MKKSNFTPYYARLIILFPKTFFLRPSDRRPLKIGIGDELAAIDTGLTKFELRRAMGAYIRSFAYNACIQLGAERVDLDSHPAGVVTIEGVEAAAASLAKYKAARAQREAIQATAVAAGASAPESVVWGLVAPEPNTTPEPPVVAAQLPASEVPEMVTPVTTGRLGLAGLRAAGAARRAAA